MGSAPTCSAGWSTTDTACAFTSLTGAIGFPILCVAWRNGLRTLDFYCETSFAREHVLAETRGRRDSASVRRAHACRIQAFSRFQLVNLQPRDVLGFRSQRVRCAGQKRESRIVHGDDVLHTKKSDGVCRFARSHRKAVTDREHGEFRLV